MPETPSLVKARFQIRGEGASFEVHFNPESMRYVITNNLRNTGSGNSSKQYVSDSTGKLSMDLVFDTTDTGEDVRLHTVRVAKLMEPTRSDKTPPVVEFAWGLYRFSGMVESYNETLDFFSADGVPLRAGVQLTLASQDRVFEGGSDERRAQTGGSLRGAGGGGDAVQAPAPSRDNGRGITQTATQAGNPAAGRELASRNGIENMRFPEAPELEVSASAATTAGVASMAAASLGASDSAFAGLRASASAGGAIRLDNFLRASGTAALGTEDPSAFVAGGQVRLQGSAGFRADVGRAGALKARIEFDGGE